MYTLGFIAVLAGLLGLMLNREGLKGLSYATAPGLAVWLVGTFVQTATWTAFFGQTFTDLLFFGGAALLFRGLSQSKNLAVPAAVVALVVMAGVHQALRPAAAEPGVATAMPELASDGELLVELNQETDAERWKRWIGAQGWTTRRAFYPADGQRTDLDDYYLVDVPADQVAELVALMAMLEATGMTDNVEPNEVIRLEFDPARTVPKSNKQLGVDDPRVNEQWAMTALEMDRFYTLLTSEQVKPQKRALVAILDTGVDAKHEDLAANFFSVNKKFDDDPQGHGTHCAGIAGAVTNNGVGVASFARSGDFFRVTSVKVLRAGGSGTQQDIINGIITAVDRGADVLSLSLGGFSTQSRQQAYSEAVRYATDKGAIVVAAAGNSNRDAATYTPVNATGMIGVSAVDDQLQRAVFSNKVNRIEMALAAPGVGIFSTKPNNNYEAHNGTSMATPFVSGLLGVMKSIRPSLTNKEAFKILQETGINTRETSNTGKLIQPARAVGALIGAAAN